MIQVNKVTTSCLERSPTIVIFLSNSSAGRKNPLWLCIRIVSAKVVIENFPPDFNGHLFVGSVFVSILCTLGMRIFKVFEPVPAELSLLFISYTNIDMSLVYLLET